MNESDGKTAQGCLLLVGALVVGVCTSAAAGIALGAWVGWLVAAAWVVLLVVWVAAAINKAMRDGD